MTGCRGRLLLAWLLVAATACGTDAATFGVLSSTTTNGGSDVWQIVCNAGGGVWRNPADNSGSFQCTR